MTAEHRVDERPVADEGSWVYLIGMVDRQGDVGLLRERVVDACEASGWPAVSRSPALESEREPGRLFEGVRHAVEHADLVVALIGSSSGSVDAELGIAYGHGRPIVGIRFSGEDIPTSETQAMLDDYEAARVISCDDLEGCAAMLRDTLSAPDFAAMIQRGASTG